MQLRLGDHTTLHCSYLVCTKFAWLLFQLAMVPVVLEGTNEARTQPARVNTVSEKARSRPTGGSQVFVAAFASGPKASTAKAAQTYLTADSCRGYLQISTICVSCQCHHLKRVQQRRKSVSGMVIATSLHLDFKSDRLKIRLRRKPESPLLFVLISGHRESSLEWHIKVDMFSSERS